MSLWDDPQEPQKDLYFDDPHAEYVEEVTRVLNAQVHHHMAVEDHLARAVSEGFILFRPIFLVLWLIWEFFIVFPRELFMMAFDIVFGRDEQNRLPYYGSNHKGSPW